MSETVINLNPMSRKKPFEPEIYKIEVTFKVVKSIPEGIINKILSDRISEGMEETLEYDKIFEILFCISDLAKISCAYKKEIFLKVQGERMWICERFYFANENRLNRFIHDVKKHMT